MGKNEVYVKIDGGYEPVSLSIAGNPPDCVKQGPAVMGGFNELCTEVGSFLPSPIRFMGDVVYKRPCTAPIACFSYMPKEGRPNYTDTAEIPVSEVSFYKEPPKMIITPGACGANCRYRAQAEQKTDPSAQ